MSVPKRGFVGITVFFEGFFDIVTYPFPFIVQIHRDYSFDEKNTVCYSYSKSEVSI